MSLMVNAGEETAANVTDLFLRNDKRSVSRNMKRGIRVTAIVAGANHRFGKTDSPNV